MPEADKELQDWFSGLSFKVKRRLAETIKSEADRLASAIKAKAPVASGKLRDSVKVRRKKNDTELEVTAGGDATTTTIRSGSGVSYDYARALEFGTVKAHAQPFFYPTYREMAPQIRENIQQAVEEAINS